MSLTPEEQRLREYYAQFQSGLRQWNAECRQAEEILNLLASLDATREELAKEREARERAERLYDDVMLASNEAGFSCVPAADAIRQLEAENADLRARLLTAAGDDLCRLSQEEIKALGVGAIPIPPKEEFLASCERFHSQIAGEVGVNHNCLTLAQLIAENEQLRAKCDELYAHAVAIEDRIDEARERVIAENAALRESIIEGDAERKRLTIEVGKLRMENERRYETLVALVKRRGFIVTEEHGLEVRLVDDDLAARRNELATAKAEIERLRGLIERSHYEDGYPPDSPTTGEPDAAWDRDPEHDEYS